MSILKLSKGSRHFLPGYGGLNRLSRTDACQRVFVSTILQLHDDETARQRGDSNLEPKIKESHRLKVDEHVGILDGNFHDSIQRRVTGSEFR